MTRSNIRRKRTPQTKQRNKRSETQARETQAAQKRAERRQLTSRASQRRRVFGWSLVILALLVGVQHLVSHMGSFTLISRGWDDLVAGYPLAALLGVGGVIVLSKT